MGPTADPLTTDTSTAQQPFYRTDALPKQILVELLDTATQAFVVHRGGSPLYVNAYALSLFGIAGRPPKPGRSVFDWVHADDRPRVAAYARARLAGRDAPEDYEFRVIREDGRELWVCCRAQVVDWSDGPAILASLTDITRHKQAERAQLRSEALFSRVFEATPNMAALSYLDTGLFLDVNDNFASAVGLTREEFLGQNIFDIGIWDDPRMPMRIRADILRSRSIRRRESQLRRKDGSTLPVALCAELLDIEEGKILLIIGRDITEDKRREAELTASRDAAEIANRTKSEFLANMSHELRTPLNAIIGFSEIIRDELLAPLPDPRYRDYAGDIQRSGTHLLEIINDILDLSKVEAGRLEIRPEPVDMAETVAQCERLVADRAAQAELEVVAQLNPEDFEVVADRRLLKQILLNLLSNAIKFTPSGGRVDIEAASLGGGGLRLTVKDSGIGMSEAEIAQALTPFGQADRSLTRRHEGTGLGLPLVAAFTEAHGGRLDIDSTPGRGTCVTVELPGESAEPQAV